MHSGIKKANLLVGIFNATERTCLYHWYTVLRGPCTFDASCYVGVCTFVVVYVCRYMYIWALIHIYIYIHMYFLYILWILDACHCTWQITTQYTTSTQELGKHLMNLFKVVSRYIHHSRMIAPGNHIRPSPTVHIYHSLHHVTMSKAWKDFLWYKKSEIGSHWISFNALEGWRCFLHRRCGSVGWVGGFHQPASVRGGVHKTFQSWTMQTTKIRRTPAPRLSIQCVDSSWSKYIYFFDVHQYCSQQGWTWITSNY